MKSVATNIVTTAAGSGDIVVAGEVTVYTKAIEIAYGEYFATSFKAASAAGGIDLKIEMEQSFRLPVTEGAADDYWKEPVDAADIVASLVVEDTIYHKALAPIPMKYIRFKIAGAAGNSADTILNQWLHKQENF